MIPLRDRNPIRTTPFITWMLIGANVLVYLYQLTLSPRAEKLFFFELAMIPARLQAALTTHEVPFVVAALPLFTSMFLHGGLLHILGNMWFLHIFGDNIEDRLGHARYLLFYVVCGVGAGLLHTAFNWNSTVPALGASGAISGILGAYIVLYPGARVLTLVPLFIVFFTVELPALVILGYWFVIQFLSGVGSIGAREAGGVAWWAHIGGFAVGFLLIRIMAPAEKPRFAYYQ